MKNLISPSKGRRRSLRCKRAAFLLFVAMAGPVVGSARPIPLEVAFLQQQENDEIKGVIVDAKNEPIVGAAIQVAGAKNRGTNSDVNGQFSLKANANETLEVSFIGMKSVTIKLSDYKNLQKIRVQLNEDKEVLNEVVVTGYGNIAKKGFTGSFTEVKRDDILRMGSRNLIDILQVFDPSFRVATNNEMGSDPNTMPEFSIRGASGVSSVTQLDKLEQSQGIVSQSTFALTNNPNAPIFIMDGYEVSLEKINDMDINRIKSVTILKDAASTAIYGSRASNGVVVIETLVPESGRLQAHYTFTGEVSVPDLSDYNLMNAKEKLNSELAFGLLNVSPSDDSYSERQIDYITKMNQIARGTDTYWLAKPLQTQFNQRHTLYLEGGENTVRYGIDLNYDNQNGVMKGSKRDNYGVGLSLDYNKNWLKFRNTASVSIMKATDSPYGSFSSYAAKQPYDSPTDYVTGKLLEVLPSHYSYPTNVNPLYEASLGSFDKNDYLELTNNLNVNLIFTSHLQFRGDFSVTYKTSNSSQFTDPTSGVYTSSTDPFNRGELTQGDTDYWGWNTNLMLWYNNSFGKSNLNFNVGFNAKEDKSEYASKYYKGFASASLHEPQFAKEMNNYSFSDNHTRLMGALAVLNYTYNEIYMLDASARADGSSEFGADERVAPFWSAGAGINVHNYKFLKNVSWLDIFRVRANYGHTGKIDFAPYMARHTFSVETDRWYPTGIGADLTYMGNEELKWEKQKQWNIGFDATVLKNRVTLGVNWYDKRTNDLITDVVIPSSSGFTSTKGNFGKVLNRGLELNLNVMAYQSRNLDVRVFGNLSHNKNEILEISESFQTYNQRVDDYFDDYLDYRRDTYYSIPFTKYEKGGSLSSIYGMKSLGISPANGKELYEYRDGTVGYEWKTTEQQILGDTNPDAQGTFGFNVRYGAFTLYTSFMYQWGGQTYNQTLVDKVENVNLYTSNADRRAFEQRWQKEGDVTSFKNISDQSITRPTSRFVEDYNYMTFNSLSLSYDLPGSFTKSIKINSARVMFSMKNIANISSVRQERGTSYPFARAFNLSLNINL